MNRTKTLEKEILRLKSAIEELSVLNELALAVGSAMDANDVLDKIVKKSVKAVRAEQGTIKLVTDQQARPLQTLIRQEDVSGSLQTYNIGTHISGWILKNQKPLMIEKLETDKRFKCTPEECRELRSVLGVPIWLKAKIIGLLIVTNKKTDTPFKENDLRLLTIIAAQSGQLIHNSQLQEEAIEKKRLSHQLDLAREIQLSLLPDKDPDFNGLEIASYFKPADTVGGDYFDYFPLNEDRFVLVIADVSGHGPPAALVMTLLKGITHSIKHGFKTPNQTLSDFNSVVCSIIPDDVFVTMQIIEIDLDKKILHFSNAGHNPPVYFNSDSGNCECLELRGYALNLMEDVSFQTRSIPIKTNDMILVYTDGIIEACTNTNEMFSIDRLKESILQKKDNFAVHIIQHIQSEIASFTGNDIQDDDMAMIAIKIQ